jgi:hypothetical protein
MAQINSCIVLFHGNCIDGWFSAFIAHSYLKNNNQVKMFPISPCQQNTWPSINEMKGSHVFLLDVSVDKFHRKNWIKNGILSIECIDHHDSSIHHWVDEKVINTSACAALQTFSFFFPEKAIPNWLHTIDRIDRWDNPTYEDRCLREVLNIIAHKPVQKQMNEAFKMTEKFITDMENPEAVSSYYYEGKQMLDQKDAETVSFLQKGSFYVLTQEHVNSWKLPPSWLGKNVFIIDNTNTSIDSTEAGHLLFEANPHLHAFINYRKKSFYTKGSMPVQKTIIVYSARSQGFNVTDGTIFKGHPTSAGATLTVGESLHFPFIVSSI